MRATVRVPVESGTEGGGFRVPRPAPERIEKAAGLLQELGFKVVSRSRFGVEVEGSVDLIRRCLQVDVGEGVGPFRSRVIDPVDELRGLVDFIEILPEPQYYTHKASHES